jgi:hypothetical protein
MAELMDMGDAETIAEPPRNGSIRFLPVAPLQVVPAASADDARRLAERLAVLERENGELRGYVECLRDERRWWARRAIVAAYRRRPWWALWRGW